MLTTDTQPNYTTSVKLRIMTSITNFETRSEMQSMLGSTNTKETAFSEGLDPRSMKCKKLIKTVVLELIRCLHCLKHIHGNDKNISEELYAHALNHTNVFSRFCYSENYFLMTLVHNLYTASVLCEANHRFSCQRNL